MTGRSHCQSRLNIGQQPVQLAGGGRVYADSPRDGPEYGLRGVVTFLFPTGG
jgi:hypothetical protein